MEPPSDSTAPHTLLVARGPKRPSSHNARPNGTGGGCGLPSLGNFESESLPFNLIQRGHAFQKRKTEMRLRLTGFSLLITLWRNAGHCMSVVRTRQHEQPLSVI